MASQPSPKLPLQDQIALSDQLPAAPVATISIAHNLRDDDPGPLIEKHSAAVETVGMRFAEVGSKVWQVAMLVIPILLTVWLTHVSSRTEESVKTRIDQQTDQQKQLFAAQVQLSQDLYKRQFDTYDKLYAQLIVIGDAIEHLEAGSTPILWKRRLTDSLAELDSLRKANRLHMSKHVYKTMGEAFQKGARMNAQDLEQLEAQMEREMKNLLESAGNESGNPPRQN